MRIRTVDELRAELRLARQRFSPREIGRATGVSHTTINLLLSDRDVPRPTTATIRKLSAWLDANGEDVPEFVEAAAVDRPPGYWQGVAEAVLRMIDAAGVELQTLIDSGVLATPRTGLTGPTLAGAAAGNGGNGALGRSSGLGGAAPSGMRGRRAAVGPREARRLRMRGPLLPPNALRPPTTE